MASDTVTQFRAAIAGAGLQPPPVIEPDGRLHRFASNGRRGDDAGWYVCHADAVPAGAFGDWRTGLSETWRADIGRRLSPAEEEALRGRQEGMRRQRDAEEAKRKTEAQAVARDLWEGSAAASDDHPYLVGKGVPSHGLRVDDGRLVVPLREGAVLHSLQFIGPDGEKRFLPGGRVQGCCFTIGMVGNAVCVVEGYATGASIHAATGCAVAVAFNAGNLTAVARSLREQHPGMAIVVCADDDSATPGNPGLTKAREAAEAVGGVVAVPDFGEGRPVGATDFNDLARLLGAEAVRQHVVPCIERALQARREESPVAAAWPKPRPIVAELKEVPSFDAEVLLPCPLRRWIMDEAERMPCPPEFVAVAAIVALGSVIGARCAVKPKANDSWQVVPNLWGGIVGDPSAKKSPAWSAALRPLDRLIAQANEAHQAALAEHETAAIVFEAKKDAIGKRIKAAAEKPGKGDPAEIARELRQHAEAAPPAPVHRRFKTNDSTVERLGELLKENPAGLLVLRDELVGLIATWEREGREGDRAFFLEAWNGNQSFDTDRIGRGHIFVPNLCVSIFGGIQPDKLTGYLEQATRALANDGMLQRFQMLVYPDARRWEWRDRAPDKLAHDRAVALFETVANFDPVTWGAASADDFARFPCFRFDDEAQRLFIEWSADLHCRRLPAEDEPLVRQHLAKYDKLFPALALIFHLVEVADGGRPGPIGRDSAMRAAAWCEFLHAHARRCYGLLKDDGLRAAQMLVGKLRRGALADGFTLRDIRRHQWRHLTEDRAIEPALDWLEDEGWLRSESTGGTGPGSGRRTVRYSINPAVSGANKDGAA